MVFYTLCNNFVNNYYLYLKLKDYIRQSCSIDSELKIIKYLGYYLCKNVTILYNETKED